MEKIDLMFLHIPKWMNYYRPISHFIWINFRPVGFLAMADLLSCHHISTQIVHLGAEWIDNHDFSIFDYLRAKAPRMKPLGQRPLFEILWTFIIFIPDVKAYPLLWDIGSQATLKVSRMKLLLEKHCKN